jgi:hypothetical protein
VSAEKTIPRFTFASKFLIYFNIKASLSHSILVQIKELLSKTGRKPSASRATAFAGPKHY